MFRGLSASSAARYFGGRHLPYMTRALYPRELRAWALLGFVSGIIEGGIAGVVVKNVYYGVVDDVLLNQAVAVVTGAPAFANLLSFLWSALAHGRDKIRFLFRQQVACVCALLIVAAAPRTPSGLIVMTCGFVTACALWSGVVTLRSTVWGANYPRHVRAAITGRLAVVLGLIMSFVGFSAGLVIQINHAAVRWMFPVIALIALNGALVYRRMRVRRHALLLAAERSHGGLAASLLSPLAILFTDRRFRHFMIAMTIFGAGNLMLLAPLIVLLTESFALPPLQQALVVTTLPLLTTAMCVPPWAALLDRLHILQFRAIHSWSFVASIATFATAAITHTPALLWLGSVFLGVGYGGGIVGWNIGHHDYAPPGRASQYMGVHVTLTGLRGLIAPFAGIALYQYLEARHPGSGRYALLAPLLLSATGASLFVWLARGDARMRHAEATA